MAREVIVRPSAEADVREAAFWYEAKREGLGTEFALELDALYDRIAQHSLQFAEIGDGTRRALLRRFPYAIYFVADDTPVVLAVLHQHRKPQTWRERA
jgi:plasmid stabilization system protein ParE